MGEIYLSVDIKADDEECLKWEVWKCSEMKITSARGEAPEHSRLWQFETIAYVRKKAFSFSLLLCLSFFCLRWKMGQILWDEAEAADMS